MKPFFSPQAKQRLQHRAITLTLLVILVGLERLSCLYNFQTDITDSASNSLAPASSQLLAKLVTDVKIIAYVKKDPGLRMQIGQLIARYQAITNKINFQFIDPASVPDKVRELTIGSEGAIFVDYQGRSERINYLDESSLTNALLSVLQDNERWLSFLVGHGERSPAELANFAYSEFSKLLARRKINAQAINLAISPGIPDNSAALVLSAPAVALLPGEIALIKRYIEKGGDIWLLAEPDKAELKVFLEQLGLRSLPGSLVDGQAKLYSIDDPRFVVLGDYPNHAITKDFVTATVYPTVMALTTTTNSSFQAQTLLKSGPLSWTETGPIATKIRFDANTTEQQGPLAFAYALTRKVGTKQQRAIVIGDGDFLANIYIGNVGNSDMGLRMVNWLIHDDSFIDIANKVHDNSLQLSQTHIAIISIGFLIVLPLVFLLIGTWVWHRRKYR